MIQHLLGVSYRAAMKLASATETASCTLKDGGRYESSHLLSILEDTIDAFDDLARHARRLGLETVDVLQRWTQEAILTKSRARLDLLLAEKHSDAEASHGLPNQLSQEEQKRPLEEDFFQELYIPVRNTAWPNSQYPTRAQYLPASATDTAHSSDSDAEASHGLAMLQAAEDDDRRRQSSHIRFSSSYESQRNSRQQHLLPQPDASDSDDYGSIDMASFGGGYDVGRMTYGGEPSVLAAGCDSENHNPASTLPATPEQQEPMTGKRSLGKLAKRAMLSEAVLAKVREIKAHEEAEKSMEDGSQSRKSSQRRESSASLLSNEADEEEAGAEDAGAEEAGEDDAGDDDANEDDADENDVDENDADVVELLKRWTRLDLAAAKY
jgi:hypothetical protein